MEDNKKKVKILSGILLFGPALLQIICILVNSICVDLWSKYGANNQLTQYAWVWDLASFLLLLTPVLCIILQIVVFIKLRHFNKSKAGLYLGIGLVLSIMLGFLALIVRSSLF